MIKFSENGIQDEKVVTFEVWTFKVFVLFTKIQSSAPSPFNALIHVY